MHLTRKLIHTIARHFDWKYADADAFLQAHFYPQSKDWQQYIKTFLLVMGIGFGGLGVVYFFAYNWDALHKFAKIGIVASLILLLVLLWYVLKTHPLLKNLLMTVASAMVGVLFAVFGQIYQTGANAFDFFMAWALFISIWTWATDFSGLWLLYLVLLNATYVLYMNQVVPYIHDTDMMLYWIMLNVLLFCVLKVLYLTKVITGFVKWLEWCLGLVVFGTTTIGTSWSILGHHEYRLAWHLITFAVIMGSALWYGLQKRELFYLGSLSFCVLLLLNVVLVKQFEHHFDIGILLLMSLLTLGGTTFIIYILLNLQKQWAHEKI